MALPGDQIRVGPGEWCGATITQKVDLFGEGNATIIGCPTSPNLAGVLRIGFFLPDASASGTTIRHFVFDGQGASNANLDPLSFAVFSRGANNVSIEQNTILGTIQAITNTNGSEWTVNHNKIQDFSVLGCTKANFFRRERFTGRDRQSISPQTEINKAPVISGLPLYRRISRNDRQQP